MARENRFAAKSGGVNLTDITGDVNQKRTHQVPSPKTEKQIEDISIDLIDEYEKNELIFGYNNFEDVKHSIEKTGIEGITVNVFTKENGRYLCYSGNTRLRVLKEMGKKKITCIIEGPVPEEHELMIKAICGNTQRDFDPFHIANEIKYVEESFKNKGLRGDSLKEAIADLTGYKQTAQKLYKQILKFDPVLQNLFDSKNVPFKPMLKACRQIPDDKVQEFADTYNALKENNIESGDLISKAFVSVMKKDITEEKNVNKQPKLGKIYKSIFNLSKSESGDYLIPDNKKMECLEMIEQLEHEIEKIKEACE